MFRSSLPRVLASTATTYAVSSRNGGRRGGGGAGDLPTPITIPGPEVLATFRQHVQRRELQEQQRKQKHHQSAQVQLHLVKRPRRSATATAAAEHILDEQIALDEHLVHPPPSQPAKAVSATSASAPASKPASTATTAQDLRLLEHLQRECRAAAASAAEAKAALAALNAERAALDRTLAELRAERDRLASQQRETLDLLASVAEQARLVAMRTDAQATLFDALHQQMFHSSEGKQLRTLLRMRGKIGSRLAAAQIVNSKLGASDEFVEQIAAKVEDALRPRVLSMVMSSSTPATASLTHRQEQADQPREETIPPPPPQMLMLSGAREGDAVDAVVSADDDRCEAVSTEDVALEQLQLQLREQETAARSEALLLEREISDAASVVGDLVAAAGAVAGEASAGAEAAMAEAAVFDPSQPYQLAVVGAGAKGTDAEQSSSPGRESGTVRKRRRWLVILSASSVAVAAACAAAYAFDAQVAPGMFFDDATTAATTAALVSMTARMQPFQQQQQQEIQVQQQQDVSTASAAGEPSPAVAMAPVVKGEQQQQQQQQQRRAATPTPRFIVGRGYAAGFAATPRFALPW